MSLSLPSQHAFCNSPPVRSSFCFTITTVNPSHRNPNFSPEPISIRRITATPSHFKILRRNPSNSPNFKTHRSVLRSYDSSAFASTTQSNNNSDGFDLDSFLSLVELLCIVSSAVISAVSAVNYAVLSETGKRVAAWGFTGLVGGVVIGAWIRRRQWKRICKESAEGERLNLIERIEKLEEDLKSSATIVRVLSRQLEKLGIRFRVTRKALKEPISETAALARKNSEAARALAAREDILEKELGEIQKVLLAMQEQQQKQLELILAIAKSGKLLESNRKQASDEPQQDTTKEHLLNTRKEPATGTGRGARNERV